MKAKAMQRRLQERQAAHARFMNGRGNEIKVEQRKASGGYRCPGSPKQGW